MRIQCAFRSNKARRAMQMRREDNEVRLAQMRKAKAHQELLDDAMCREQQVKRSAISIQDLYRNKIARDTIARLREERRYKVRMDALIMFVWSLYV